jgi:hypothetical protein
MCTWICALHFCYGLIVHMCLWYIYNKHGGPTSLCTQRSLHIYLLYSYSHMTVHLQIPHTQWGGSGLAWLHLGSGELRGAWDLHCLDWEYVVLLDLVCYLWYIAFNFSNMTSWCSKLVRIVANKCYVVYAGYYFIVSFATAPNLS